MKLIILFLGFLFPSALAANQVFGLDHLIEVYPDASLSAFYDEKGNAYLNASGRYILFQEAAGCPKADPEAEADQPLCAMFQQKYPTGKEGRNPQKDFSPGRVRNEELLKLLYGENKREVENNCVPVNFFNRIFLMNKKHGAAAALSRVELKLKDFVRKHPEKKKYIVPSAGTFVWRTISGSQRLSSHSFAIAIDLNVEHGPYWRWSEIKTANKYWDSYPQEIVDIFESEYFIWGGKWDKFDFMHFEYRPELFIK